MYLNILPVCTDFLWGTCSCRHNASCGDECVIDTYLKIALIVATVVSPQLGGSNAGETISDKNITQINISQSVMKAPKSPLPPQKQISSELPLLFARIAYCESRDRQFKKDGTILRGTANPYDIGRYQINSIHWEEEAEKLGIDMYTEDGNEAMALYIYKKFGTKPWRSSQKCWDRKDQAYLNK